jgi:hypothetical protein
LWFLSCSPTRRPADPPIRTSRVDREAPELEHDPAWKTASLREEANERL